MGNHSAGPKRSIRRNPCPVTTGIVVAHCLPSRCSPLSWSGSVPVRPARSRPVTASGSAPGRRAPRKYGRPTSSPGRHPALAAGSDCPSDRPRQPGRQPGAGGAVQRVRRASPVIGAAHVALAGKGSAIVPGSEPRADLRRQPDGHHPARRAGAERSGRPRRSTPLGSLAVSLYLPEVTPTATWHNEGVQTAYISGPGDFTNATDFTAAQTTTSRIFLSGIMVDADAGRPRDRARSAIRSPTAPPRRSTPTTAGRTSWPSGWSRPAPTVAVLNEGISGARVLRDRMGDNALARFDRDVLSHPHADTVDPDDGHQRHRLAGHDPRARGRARAVARTTSSPATGS